MYNVYAYDKKLKQEKQEKSRAKSIKASEQNREVLSARYKDRINETLLKLSKDSENLPRPQRAQTAINSERSWLKSSGFFTDQERIKESENRNNWLDTTPSKKLVFKLRPREKQKEIQKEIKLRAKSGGERLLEKVHKLKEFLDSSEPPESGNKYLYKNFFGVEKPKFSGGKEVLDYYHFKTHFKTIESLALDLHSSIRNMSRAEVKKKHMDEKLGMTENKGKKENIVEEALCKEDIMPISEELLEKYGLWEGRKPIEPRTEKTRQGTPRWVISRINAEKEKNKFFEL
jgi:hypothetical protein